MPNLFLELADTKFFACLIIVTLLISTNGIASTRISGSFVATQECEAFISKNKRNNPDHALLNPGESYQLIEANKKSNPNWYRIRLNKAKPSLRWVFHSCGSVNSETVDTTQGHNKKQGASCETPSREDSYVLALSWQPAFCETHRNKPECKISDKKSYQSRHFTLHGLWPNLSACGAKYGFCGKVKTTEKNFCNYPALDLNGEIRNKLEIVMPSARYGSCLQRHEWFKHGSCQSRDVNEYFSLAIELTQAFNDSGMADYVANNIGKDISLSALQSQVDQALGTGASEKVQFLCQNRNLQDVYIHLPSSIDAKMGFKQLLFETKGRFTSKCSKTVHIDKVGFGN